MFVTKLAVGGCCRLRAGLLRVGSAEALWRPQSAPRRPACPPVTGGMPPTGVLANPTLHCPALPCPALPQDKEELVLRPFNFCIIDEVGKAAFALHAKRCKLREAHSPVGPGWPASRQPVRVCRTCSTPQACCLECCTVSLLIYLLVFGGMQ